MDAIAAFAEHVADRSFQDLPESAANAAKTFILDTLGVGLAGSSGPKAQELVRAQYLWGDGDDARVWSTGEGLPAPAAAFCNAHQVHNAEFDCIHEAAVAHVMTVLLPVVLAGVERMSKIEARPVNGRRLIEAVVLGVDVAASLGLAATSGLRFFRPGTVGAFGGCAALGKLMGFDSRRLQHAFAIAYGQLCGNMQAHTEGSLLLAMQMGFNARKSRWRDHPRQVWRWDRPTSARATRPTSVGSATPSTSEVGASRTFSPVQQFRPESESAANSPSALPPTLLNSFDEFARLHSP